VINTLFRMLRDAKEHPLTAGKSPQAAMRFVRWQLGTRLLPVPHVMPFVEGTVLVMERGMTGATGNWYFGLHEFSDMAFVLHMLRDDDLFADVGANVGSYSVLASGVTGARTIGFEPVPDTFRKLMRNVEINGIAHRFKGHNIGLVAREETLRFSSELDTVNHVVVGPSEKATIDVPVRRFDDVLAGEVPVVIKIDVEGWEAEVLEGMPQTLADPRLLAIIAETNESSIRYQAANIDRFGEAMRAHGFIAHTYDPFKRALIAGGSSHNTIFARDLDATQSRLTTAAKRRVLGQEF
jgi:FkbM family methyltransferase